MSTAIQPISNLDLTAPDVMDLHSDDGLDFGDGDIELNLEPPAHRQEDDVSITDATADTGLDTHHIPADQDDFMADHEEYIEEDEINYGDDTSVTHALTGNTAATQEQSLAPADEDLIDYSDDEDEQPQDYQGASLQQAATDVAQDTAQGSGGAIQAKPTLGKAPMYGSRPSHDRATTSHPLEDDDNTVLEADEHDRYDAQEADNEADEHTDGDDGGVLLQGHDAPINGVENDNDDNEDQQDFELRPITINYEGNELWLFKQYDTEGSGDFLLEDVSIIHSNMSDFFKACRSCLGEDISHETELGLRFDHLHNMELYEDSIACVTVSLERMINLYHTLQAQDGNHDPESFYLCLLSRPRFATLLADVAKHVEQGSGYSGFNSAVAAGETHFADAHSGHSTEHEVMEWENDEEEGANPHTESPSEAEPGVEYAEPEGQEDEEHGDDEENIEYGVVQDVRENGATLLNTTGQDHDGVVTTPQADADNSETIAQTSQSISPSAQHKSPSSIVDATSDARAEQLLNDTVDYSDVKDDEDSAEPGVAPTTNPSAPSSTVQGDPADTSVHSATSGKTESAHDLHQNEVSHNAEAEFDAHQSNVQEFGDEVTAESYQDYTHAYDEEDPFPGFQVDNTEDYSTEPDFAGYTNQDYANYDYQELDQQLQNDFLSGGEFNANVVDNSATVENNYTGEDDFLNLNAPEWGNDQDPLDMTEGETMVHGASQDEEEEDGAAEQPAVAASSAADAVAASSTGLTNSSPQGQKRSIDEVGVSVDDAPDSIGAFGRFLISRRLFLADHYITDTKRPRL